MRKHSTQGLQNWHIYLKANRIFRCEYTRNSFGKLRNDSPKHENNFLSVKAPTTGTATSCAPVCTFCCDYGHFAAVTLALAISVQQRFVSTAKLHPSPQSTTHGWWALTGGLSRGTGCCYAWQKSCNSLIVLLLLIQHVYHLIYFN